MIGIIPAAGKGVRFKELGKNYPKAILPFKEKPIIIHQIEWMEQHGCDDIRVVVNHQSEMIEDILKIYNKTVTIIKQTNQSGLSGAVYQALSKSDSGKPVLITLGDLIVNEQILKKFDENFISIKYVPDYSRWCMVEISENNSLKFIDKPKEKPNTEFALSGIYFILDSKDLFDAISKQFSLYYTINNEFQLSTALQFISEEQKISVRDIDIIDFGTLDEYLKNKSIKQSRSFNFIVEDDMFIEKSSEKYPEKIVKEFNWYNNLPDTIKYHTPKIFKSDFFNSIDYPSYKMEKILAPTLREIYLYLDDSLETWESIFESIFGLLDEMRKYGSENTFMEDIVIKTKSRVSAIDIPIDYGMIDYFINTFTVANKSFDIGYSLIHGDFCFSNLFFEYNTNKIIMIDPRGELFGSHYYEIAKLFHSIVYDYDFIDSELYIKTSENFQIYNKGKLKIKELFLQIIGQRYTHQEIQYIKLITASLFLSMIPLHSHDKTNQIIYYNTFKKIWDEYNADI